MESNKVSITLKELIDATFFITDLPTKKTIYNSNIMDMDKIFFIKDSQLSEMISLRDKLYSESEEKELDQKFIDIYKPLNIYEVTEKITDSSYWSEEFKSEFDHYFFKIPFTLRPPKNYKFISATIDLSYYNESDEVLTYSLAPKKITDKINKTFEYGINFDGKLINIKLLPSIEFKWKEILDVHYPRIIGSGEGFPKAAWDFEMTKSHPYIIGDQDLFLIIRQKKKSNTKVLSTLYGTMAHKKKVYRFLGSILLNKFIKGKIDVSKDNYHFIIPEIQK